MTKTLLKEGQFRFIETPDNFANMMNGIKGGQFFVMGYVNAAKVNYPTKQERNPATNRMRKVNDYETFGKNLGLSKTPTGVIKLTVYNTQWQNDAEGKYGEWKNKEKELNTKYGIAKPEKDKEDYAERLRYGQHDMLGYSGNNDAKRGNTYTPLIMNGIKPLNTHYFVVYEDGSLEAVTKDKLELLPSKVYDKLAALRNAGATEEELQALGDIDYRRFIHGKILFLSATVDGVPSLYFNKNVGEALDNVTGVNPDELYKLCKDRYPQYLQEAKKQNKLKAIIKEQVKKALKEYLA